MFQAGLAALLQHIIGDTVLRYTPCICPFIPFWLHKHAGQGLTRRGEVCGTACDDKYTAMNLLYPGHAISAHDAGHDTRFSAMTVRHTASQRHGYLP